MGCGITGFHILSPQSLHFCYAFLCSFISLSSYSLFTHEALCPGIPTTFHVHFTCILLPCLWSIHTLSSVFICKCTHSPCVGGIDEDETRCLIWLSMSRFFWASSTLLPTGTPNIVPKTHSSVRPPIRSFLPSSWCFLHCLAYLNMGCLDSPVLLCPLSLQLHTIWILHHRTAETAFSKVTRDRSTSLMAFLRSPLPASLRDQTLMIAFHVLLLSCLSSMSFLAPFLVTRAPFTSAGRTGMEKKDFCSRREGGALWERHRTCLFFPAPGHGDT